MSFTSPPGVFDILPEVTKEPWRASHLWSYVENIMRQTALQYGYREIRTPIFEKTELFLRGVGEGTDIVSKEMYTLIDKGERSITLRPEGTAPVIRSFVENNLQQFSTVQKLFYIGPMFRYERPQAGRYRQFHQFGAEAIGIDSPEQDVEMIDMAYTIFNRLGLKDLEVSINSIGDAESRSQYRDALKTFLQASLSQLSADSQRRFETNPLRILDSKDAKDQELLKSAPSILDFLSEKSKEHFERVKKGLDLLKVPYKVNPRMVRGLDYYNNCVYEIVSGELGSQNSVGGGGRYDGLIKLLGGPDLPSTGYATGIERIIQTMIAQKVAVPDPYSPILYIVPLGDKARDHSLQIISQLRHDGVPCQVDLSGRKLNKCMQYADQIKAQYVAVIGDQELENGKVELKEMKTGEKFMAPLKHLSRIFQIELNSERFIEMWQDMSRPFDDPSEAQFFAKKLSKQITDNSILAKTLENAVEKIKSVI